MMHDTRYSSATYKSDIVPWVLLGLCVLCPFGAHAQDTLTIYDVQFSTADEDWRSRYEGETVSVVGGIVTHKVGFRITLQDATLGDAWAGVEIRAWQNTEPLGTVSVGDRVDFYDVSVEEFVGGTIPQFLASSGYRIVSSGNNLPEPVIVPAADLRLPPNRDRCEKYEGMLVAVEDVRVGRLDLGKADDNYELFTGADTLWASDYYNTTLPPPYPAYYVERGERYRRIVGVYQEYSKPEDGWNYYQLLPRGGDDYEKSDLYVIRDVQESSSADGWASLLTGSRISLRAVVASRRTSDGLISLVDPLLGNEWAGVFVRDVSAQLAGLVLGEEVELRDVLVVEESGLTALAYDAESSYSAIRMGVGITGIVLPASELRLGAGPETSEKYEGMLVSILNVTVVERGTPEGSQFYFLAAGGDTVLASDNESAMLHPDSTFFVRAGDRLGRVRGIVMEQVVPEGTRYVLRPRSGEDYWFVGGRQALASWGRIKERYRQGGS